MNRFPAPWHTALCNSAILVDRILIISDPLWIDCNYRLIEVIVGLQRRGRFASIDDRSQREGGDNRCITPASVSSC